MRDPEAVALQMDAAIAEVVAEGADAVVLGGAALAGMGPRLQRNATVPLLDGIACGVKLLEMLVALNPPKPTTGSYARPRGRETTGLDPALAALLRGG